jgi:type II secretory pathway pseudopilin PulG
MVALLVALGIMAVMMTVAMPVWKQAAQREREEELVFRGQQYVHAITMFSRKYANAFPPNLDVLVEQKFLRKKYKDPITSQDFQPIPAGQQGTPGLSGPQSGPLAGPQSGRQTGRQSDASPSPQSGREQGGQRQGAGGGRDSAPAPTPVRGTGPAVGGRGGTMTTGGAGIIGVVSKSKDKSIRLYNGRNRYNEWAFVYTAQMQTPGGGAPGAGAPGQRGQQPGPPGRQGGPGTFSPVGPRGQPPGRGGPGGRNPFEGGVSPFQPQPPPPRGRSGG